MSRAVELAELGRYTCQPNPRVGCVFARHDASLAEGWHRKTGGPHAEIEAIRSATSSLAGSCCYVTLEPCNHTGRTPACTESLMAAGVSRVVVPMPDPNPLVAGRGIDTLRRAGIQVDVGLLAGEAAQLNRGFISRMQHQRPFITCKLAISLDGKVALASGASQWITGEAARLDVQRLRASSSAVMTGINTVLADDPKLNVRQVDTAGRQPLRVVLDRGFRLPPAARLLSLPGQSIVMGQAHKASARRVLEEAGAIIECIDAGRAGFMPRCLALLAEKYQVNDLLVEAGPTLSGALLQADLVDELHVYQSPCLLGPDALDMINLEPLTDMQERLRLELIHEAMFAEDRKLVFRLHKKIRPVPS